MSTVLRVFKSFLSLLIFLFRCVFYRVVSSFLTGFVMLFVAVLMYVTFYQAYMPVVSHVKPVYLQFRYVPKTESILNYLLRGWCWTIIWTHGILQLRLSKQFDRIVLLSWSWCVFYDSEQSQRWKSKWIFNFTLFNEKSPFLCE